MRHDDVCNSSLMMPLVVGGSVIGVLRLDSLGQTRQFPADRRSNWRRRLPAKPLSRCRMPRCSSRQPSAARELETLFELAQATAVTLDLGEVVRRVTIQMLTALQADACTVFMWDDVINRLKCAAILSARDDSIVADQVGDSSICSLYPLREKALNERELVIVRAEDTDLPDGEAELMDRHHVSIRILIPLVVNDISIGLVEIESLDEHPLLQGRRYSGWRARSPVRRQSRLKMRACKPKPGAPSKNCISSTICRRAVVRQQSEAAARYRSRSTAQPDRSRRRFMWRSTIQRWMKSTASAGSGERYAARHGDSIR